MEEWDWRQFPSFMLVCYRDARTQGLPPDSARTHPHLSGSLRPTTRDPQQKQKHSSLRSSVAWSGNTGSAQGLNNLRSQNGKASGALAAEGWSSRRKAQLT